MSPVDTAPEGGEALHVAAQPPFPQTARRGNASSAQALHSAAAGHTEPTEHPTESPREPQKPASPRPGDEAHVPKPQ